MSRCSFACFYFGVNQSECTHSCSLKVNRVILAVPCRKVDILVPIENVKAGAGNIILHTSIFRKTQSVVIRVNHNNVERAFDDYLSAPQLAFAFIVFQVSVGNNIIAYRKLAASQNINNFLPDTVLARHTTMVCLDRVELFVIVSFNAVGAFKRHGIVSRFIEFSQWIKRRRSIGPLLVFNALDCP